MRQMHLSIKSGLQILKDIFINQQRVLFFYLSFLSYIADYSHVTHKILYRVQVNSRTFLRLDPLLV